MNGVSVIGKCAGHELSSQVNIVHYEGDIGDLADIIDGFLPMVY